MAVTMPVKIYDLVNTVEMVLAQIERRYKKDKKKPKKRSEKEENYIKNAKLLLMETKGMTEEEAYRYIRELSRRKQLSMARVAGYLIEQLGGKAP